ncbi:cytochrome b562 [Gemmatimonas sp.]|uniref:cytochrome b562 n=1 Tax=Gemmatimonas sp. TaxID=1962908 RepID=UPI003DA435ED
MTSRIRQLGTALVFALTMAGTAQAQQDESKTPLGKKMAAMNTAFKAVGRQIDDPSKNAATLEQIAIIETNAKAALSMEPEKKEKIPAGEQAKFVADYQAEMKKMLTVVDKLKVAVKANNNAEAVKIIDEMKSAQREGHKEFRLKKAGAPPA